MIISFSGIDGSGKSTYANVAMGYFKDNTLKSKYKHIIRDSFYHIILHNFIGKASKSSQKSLEKSLRNRKNRIYFAILKSIKKALILINIICFNLRYGRYKNSMAKNIICDRYFYDEIVQMLYLGLAGKNFISFYNKLIIEPDIAFFIKVKPEIAYERKKESEKGHFLEKAKLYDKIMSSPSVICISDGSIDDNSNLISEKIEQMLKSL